MRGGYWKNQPSQSRIDVSRGWAGPLHPPSPSLPSLLLPVGSWNSDTRLRPSRGATASPYCRLRVRVSHFLRFLGLLEPMRSRRTDEHSPSSLNLRTPREYGCGPWVERWLGDSTERNEAMEFPGPRMAATLPFQLPPFSNELRSRQGR